VTVLRVKEALHKWGELLAALARRISIGALVTSPLPACWCSPALSPQGTGRAFTMPWCGRSGATRGWRLGMVYMIGMASRALAVLAALFAARSGMAIAAVVLDVPLVFAGRARAFTIAGGALARSSSGL